MIVTIDGPAGAGKSCAARGLAKRLGFSFLDTGALYRAVTLAGMRCGVDWQNDDALAEVAAGAEIRLTDDRVFLDDEDVTDEIRALEITTLTRHAADNRQVRKRLSALQHEFAAGKNVVTEGRDQATEVFPDAECKIFLTAADEVRAQRRYEDLLARGEQVTLAEVLEKQQARDRRDHEREFGGLQKTPDSLEVLTDGMTPTDVIDRLEEIVRSCQESLPVVKTETMSLWYKFVRIWCRLACVFPFPCRIQGQENMPATGPILLLSNHLSHLDVIAIATASPRRLRALARESLFVGPFAWLIRSLGAIPVGSAGATLSSLRATFRHLENGTAMLIFPEGERSEDGELAELMPGFTILARKKNPAVVPMAVAGTFEAWPRRHWLPRPGRMAVVFGKPIPTDNLGELSDEAFGEIVSSRLTECHEEAKRLLR